MATKATKATVTDEIPATLKAVKMPRFSCGSFLGDGWLNFQIGASVWCQGLYASLASDIRIFGFGLILEANRSYIGITLVTPVRSFFIEYRFRR